MRIKLFIWPLLSLLACSSGPIDESSGPTDEVDENLGTVEQAVNATCTTKPSCNGITNSKCTPQCPDVTQTACSLEKWPGGVIWYEWFKPKNAGAVRHSTPDAHKADILAAMARWEAASSGYIDFRENTNPDQNLVRFRFISSADAAFGTGGPMSYKTCKAKPYDKNNPDTSGCFVALGGGQSGNVDHELGHGVGLNHTFTRNDRAHYMKLAFEGCPSDWDTKRCSSPLKQGAGSGPFDFTSVMMYAVTDPDITRWDGSAICAGQDCKVCSTGPTTAFYRPTPADGSAVIEMYSDWWSRYQPLGKDVGATQPLNNDLAPGVFMVGSPAVESWESGMLDIFVRGTNNHIYVKNKTNAGSPPPATWSNWIDLGGQLVSDPGATAWSANRVDVVAKGSGGDIMMLTYNGAWQTWKSIGRPAGVTVSAPAITSWGPGRLDVFVRGSDNRLYQRTCVNASCVPGGPGWTAWTVRGNGVFWGYPAAVSRGPGLIDVFMHGWDHRLWGINYTNAWSDFYPLNNGIVLFGTNNGESCPNCSSPAVTSRGTNMMDIIVRGTDNRAWISSWTGQATWPGGSSIGGQLTGNPATVTRRRTTDRIDLVVTMADTGSHNEQSMWWKTFP